MELIDLFGDMELNEDAPAGSVPGEFMFATVKTASGSGSAYSLKLQFDGDSEYSTKYYRTLNNVSLATGSRVLVLKVSGTYIILGRVYN